MNDSTDTFTPDLMPGMYDEAATAAAIRLKPTSLRNIRLRDIRRVVL